MYNRLTHIQLMYNRRTNIQLMYNRLTNIQCMYAGIRPSQHSLPCGGVFSQLLYI